MITLYQFLPQWGLPNASPFCMKLETYLRLTKLPYENAYTSDPRKAPKGKFPYIKDGTTTLGDSGLIIAYLKDRYGDPLDAALPASERATALAFERLLDEHLYWAIVYSRWFDDRNWPIVRQAFFGHLPPLLRTLIPNLIRKKFWAQVHGHGIGRHNADEIYYLGNTNLTAISDFLADKPFFMGNTPTTIDASVHAYLANILDTPFDSPLKRHATTFANLRPYCERMKAHIYKTGFTGCTSGTSDLSSAYKSHFTDSLSKKHA